MSTLDQSNGFKNRGLPINGARPAPLRVNKNSCIIHKRAARKLNEPIIIYAESPKVIHTKPQEFMAVVQRLTGLDPSQSKSHNEMDHGDPDLCHEEDHHLVHGSDFDDREYSSSGSDDPNKIEADDLINIKEEIVGNKNIASYLVSPTMFMPPKKASIGDIPLYTPTGMDWAF